MNIVITNSYCYLNKGDAGIIIAMIDRLKEKYGSINISLVSLYPEIDKGKYGDNITIVDAPIMPIQSVSRIKRVFHNLKYYLLTIARVKLNRNTSFIRCIKDANMIISCGGGYMQCRGVKSFVTEFIMHYVQLQTALLCKKKYVIFAQTVGPFSNISRFLSKSIIDKAAGVLAREKISYDYVKKNFSNIHTYLTSDIAFLLDNKAYTEITFSDGLNVGLTVRDWHFPGKENRKAYKDKYLHSIIEFVDWLIVKYKAHVYIMPQVIGPGVDNDLLISRTVKEKSEFQNSIMVVDKDISPQEIKFLYSKMDYFVGTRMHSNIFSLANLVPCLAISYDYKTDGIMRMVGMGDYIIDINSISVDDMKFKFEKLVENDNCKEMLNKAIDKVKEQANLNIELLDTLFDGK